MSQSLVCNSVSCRTSHCQKCQKLQYWMWFRCQVWGNMLSVTTWRQMSLMHVHHECILFMGGQWSTTIFRTYCKEHSDVMNNFLTSMYTWAPVVLYGCETWSLTLKEERRLRVFENRVLRKVFGPKRDEATGEWRKLHNEELNDL